MRKCKFRKGDWVIITKSSWDIKKGTVTQIDEDDTRIPFTTHPFKGKKGACCVAINEENAELLSFKMYIKLCM